MTFVTQ